VQILWSDNKELNRWSSLARAVQYLTPEEEMKEKKKYQKKGHNLQKKKTVLTSCYGYDVSMHVCSDISTCCTSFVCDCVQVGVWDGRV